MKQLYQNCYASLLNRELLSKRRYFYLGRYEIKQEVKKKNCLPSNNMAEHLTSGSNPLKVNESTYKDYRSHFKCLTHLGRADSSTLSLRIDLCAIDGVPGILSPPVIFLLSVSRLFLCSSVAFFFVLQKHAC